MSREVEDDTCVHGELSDDCQRCLEASTRETELLRPVRNGKWLDAQHFEALRYAIPGMLPEGFTILIGPPKAGKSWLTLGTLLAVAGGGRALGRIDTGPPRPVLYLALEDGHRRMQDRCRALLGSEAIPEQFHYVTAIKPGLVMETIEAFLASTPRTALVVIDTLGKVMPPAMPGESAYARDYRIGGRLKRIADDRPGLAVVVLHHDRKAGGDDFVDSVSGTHGLAGSADTIVVLSRSRHSADGLLKITGRDVAEAEYALVMADGAWSLDGHTLEESAAQVRAREESASLGDRSAEVLAFVRAAGPQGVKAAEAAKRFGSEVYQYLRRQVDAGRLTKLARGIYVAPESVRSVRNGSDTSDTSHTVREATAATSHELDLWSVPLDEPTDHLA